MALLQQGDKFIIGNPQFGSVDPNRIEFTLPENQLFRFGGSNDPQSDIGYRSGNQINLLDYKTASSLGIDTSKLDNLGTNYEAFVREGLLSKSYNDGSDPYFKQFLPGTGTVASTSGPTVDVSDVISAQLPGVQAQAANPAYIPPAPAQTPATDAFNIAATSSPSTYDPNTNPFFGIPAGAAQTYEQAAAIKSGQTSPPISGTTPGISGPTTTQVAQNTLGRLLGPTEFEQLRKKYGVSEANFDQYFTRDDKGNIYLKQNAPIQSGSPTSQTSNPGNTSTGTSSPDSSTGTTATNVLESLGLPEIPSAADLIADVLGSAEFKVIQDRLEAQGLLGQASAEAAKDLLEAKFASDKSALEDKLADRGLAFSGIRGIQVKGLADSLAASKLDVDRKLASKVLDMDADLMDTVLELVSDRIEEAKDGRKEAIGFLEDMGLTINPVTGELTPTLEARKAEAASRLSQAKFQLDLAKEARVSTQAEKPLTFTNAAGVVTAVDPNTGQTVWTRQVGRAGSASPNITVTPIADPITGGIQAIQTIDRDTGEVKWVDPKTGKDVDPSQIQLEEPQDPFDTYFDSIFNEILGEL